MGALDSFMVVDFGQYVAGPVTGMLLADQGADVVKIEPPDGPRMASDANATWNRGKRSLTLDLTTPEDLTVAKQLIDRADVVIENFRPGVMERLGLGEEALRATNPGLVYCSIPAFGPEDPRSEMPGWEGVVMAAADVFRPSVTYRDLVQQLHRRPSLRSGVPVFTAEPVASMFAAVLSAVGITAALRVRDETGLGQRVEVPLFDALVQAIGMYAMAKLPFKPTFSPAVGPWNHQYECQDGRWIHLACHDPEHAGAFADLVANPQLVADEQDQQQPKSDAERQTETILALQQIFRSRPAEAWEELLIEHALPGAICRSSAEWLQDPLAAAGPFLTDIDDPQLGATVQPAPLVRLRNPARGSDGTADAQHESGRQDQEHDEDDEDDEALNPTAIDTPSFLPAPSADQHRSELLAEAETPLPERRAASISAPLLSLAGPLQGIRVLDFGVDTAGAMCGRTLAEFGAEVIKIDDVAAGPVKNSLDLNRGKRNVLVDLESDANYDKLLELVATADVVIESFPPDEAADLGFDHRSLSDAHPTLIHVSISAYGETGTLSAVPGTGETADALTGLQVRFGGKDHPTVWPYPAATEYGTGLAAAFGVLSALLQRSRDGSGQQVLANLAGTSGFIQSAYLIDHDQKRWDEPSGPDQLGFGVADGPGVQELPVSTPIHALYACDDGWLFLGARNAEQLKPLFGQPDVGLGDRIIEWCEQQSVDDAVDKLVREGVGAHGLTWLNDTLNQPVVARRGLSVVQDYGGETGLLRSTGPAAWLSRSAVGTGALQTGTPGVTRAIGAGKPTKD